MIWWDIVLNNIDKIQLKDAHSYGSPIKILICENILIETTNFIIETQDSIDERVLKISLMQPEYINYWRIYTNILVQDENIMSLFRKEDVITNNMKSIQRNIQSIMKLISGEDNVTINFNGNRKILKYTKKNIL